MAWPLVIRSSRAGDPAFLDELFEHYLDWKEASVEVSEAYTRWQQAVSEKRSDAFGDYRRALGIEEETSDLYAELLAVASDAR